MRAAYALETFSLREAAATLANVAGMLASVAQGAADNRALIAAGLRELARYSAPLMPGFAGRLRDQLAMNGDSGLPHPATPCEVAVPRLDPAVLLQPIGRPFYG
jgi:hypothetical protein